MNPLRVFVTAYVLSIAAAACGSSGPAATPARSGALPGICPQPAGAYLITLDRTGGDCDGVQARITKLEVIGEPPSSSCHIIDSRAAPLPAGCRYEETQSCLVNGLDLRGTLTLDVVGELSDLRGNYVFQAQNKNGARCIATYAARFVKAGAAR